MSLLPPAHRPSQAAASPPPRAPSLQPTIAASDPLSPWPPAQRPSQAAASPPPHVHSLQQTIAASDHSVSPWPPAQRPSQAAASPPPRAPSLQHPAVPPRRLLPRHIITVSAQGRLLSRL